MSTMTVKDNDYNYTDELNYKYKPGLYAGFLHEFKYINPVSIETGIAFSMKGYKVKDDKQVNGKTATLKVSVNLYYIELPLNLKISNNVEGVKFFFIAGPYIGAAFMGDVKAELTYDGKTEKEDKDITIGMDNDKDMKVFDFGFNFGFGLDFKDVQLSLNYSLGLSNVTYVSKNGYSTSNRLFTFTAGIPLRMFRY